MEGLPWELLTRLRTYLIEYADWVAFDSTCRRLHASPYDARRYWTRWEPYWLDYSRLLFKFARGRSGYHGPCGPDVHGWVRGAVVTFVRDMCIATARKPLEFHGVTPPDDDPLYEIQIQWQSRMWGTNRRQIRRDALIRRGIAAEFEHGRPYYFH